MSYPINNTFDTAPPAGYLTDLGGMSHSHDATNHLMVCTATKTQSILVVNEPQSFSAWFEADIELVSDPSARKHLGLWITHGNDSEGIRFAHLDGYWVVSYWSTAFVEKSMLATVNEGGGIPTFNVGERHTLRVDASIGEPDALGIRSYNRLRFSVDGVVLFDIFGQFPWGMVPGIFLYGCTANLHSIAGDEPSALGIAPLPHGVLRGGLVRQPYIQDVLDGYYRYAMRGKVTRDGVAAPNVRVWLFDRVEPIAKRQTVTDAQGGYVFAPLRPSVSGYTVLGFDDTGAFDPEAKDMLQPVEDPP